jgi:hypothetical protein
MKTLHRRVTKLENTITPKHKRVRLIFGDQNESEADATKRYNAENPTDPILPDDDVIMIVRVISSGRK